MRFSDPESVKSAEHSGLDIIADSVKNRQKFQKDVTKVITSSIQRGDSQNGPVRVVEPIALEKSSPHIEGTGITPEHS